MNTYIPLVISCLGGKMSKQSHTCSICHRRTFNHTVDEMLICKRKMKQRSSNLSRATFSTEVKKRVMENQKGRCYMCHEYWIHADFHHINDRCDNSFENCVVLCPNCHYDITFQHLDLRDICGRKKNVPGPNDPLDGR